MLNGGMKKGIERDYEYCKEVVDIGHILKHHFLGISCCCFCCWGGGCSGSGDGNCGHGGCGTYLNCQI